MVIIRILGVFYCARGTYLYADQINNRTFSKTDKYFPKKNGKLNVFFYFYKKDQPVRWVAYWIEQITQIIMLIFIICLSLGNLITGSWDFVTTAFVMPWIIILFIYPCVFEVAVDVYVFFRNVLDKDQKKG